MLAHDLADLLRTYPNYEVVIHSGTTYGAAHGDQGRCTGSGDGSRAVRYVPQALPR